jgi:hypothetical protein
MGFLQVTIFILISQISLYLPGSDTHKEQGK